MKQDILKELAEGKVSPGEAQRIFDAALDAGKMGFGEGLSLSRAEHSAYCHGVELHELSKWRYNGWPDKCSVCGKAIDIPKGGWLPKEVGRGHHHVLRHLQCPAKVRLKNSTSKRSRP